MSAKNLANINQSNIFIASACVNSNGEIKYPVISPKKIQALYKASESEPQMIIDLSKVTTETYYGKQLLLHLAIDLDLKGKGKKIILCSASRELRMMLDTSPFNEFYTVTELDCEEALWAARLLGKEDKLPVERNHDNNIFNNLTNQNELHQLVDLEQSPQFIAASDDRTAYLADLLKAVPADADYGQVVSVLSSANHDFRREMAGRLAPALNAHIRGMEHDTLDQKKELARWVNDQLEPLGLAVQCPNTGRPAKLRGMSGGSDWPDTGRFCFETQSDGKREKSSYSETLPELTLTDSDPSQELEPSWEAKVGPKTRRLGRKRP